jgi:hypothetical protein
MPEPLQSFQRCMVAFQVGPLNTGLITTNFPKWTPPDYILCLGRLFEDRPCHLPKVVVALQIYRSWRLIGTTENIFD